MNKFISVLDKIATVGKDIWKVAEPVLDAAEPEIDLVFPLFGPIWDFTEGLVKNAEISAASAGATKAGTKKSALVLASLIPWLEQNAPKLGIQVPTSAQAQAWINIVVTGLKTFGYL